MQGAFTTLVAIVKYWLVPICSLGVAWGLFVDFVIVKIWSPLALSRGEFKSIDMWLDRFNLHGSVSRLLVRWMQRSRRDEIRNGSCIGI